jgi:hypothetical protein
MRPACTPTISACLAIALFACGCTTKSSTEPTPDPGPPGPPGRIEFSVSPASVPWSPLGPPGFSSYCNANNQTEFGPFVWTLRETGGGTVTVNRFTARAVSKVVEIEISNLTQLIGLLTQELTGTSGSSFTLQPNQTLTSKERFTCQPTQPGAGTPIFWQGSNLLYTVSGTDSNGTAVSTSATLDIQASFTPR